MKGMFEYYGRIEGLKKELEEYRATLEEAYRDAFGNGLIDEFTEKAGKILTPECFRENADAEGALLLDENYSGVTNLGVETFAYPKTDNPLMKRDGGFDRGDTQLHTAPYFLFPEGGFTQKRPKLPRYLQSFLHEYNHFIQYVIQPFPLQGMLAVPIFSLQKLGYEGNSITELALIAKDRHPAPVAVSSYIVKLSEAMAAKMDIDVWKRLGYKRHHIVTDFGEMMLSGTMIEQLSRDYFRPIMRNWQDFNFSRSRFVKRFMNTTKGRLRIYKHSPEEFKRVDRELTQ